MQIRSKIQHSWATAVEVVGAFTKQALKASAGDPRWLDFFKYTSVEFSKLENCVIDQNEEKNKDDQSKGVVLVLAASVRDLKKAYPNYFADTDDFEKYVAQVYKANN